MTPTLRVFAAALALASSAATAQWDPSFTANLGAGYGSIALSQSVLSGTRRLGQPAQGDGNAPPPPHALTQNPLGYISDPALSQKVKESFVDMLSRQNPALKPQMEQAFANDAVLVSFEKLLHAHGYSSHDLADVMTTLLVVSWEITTGGNASTDQINGADRQTRNVFLHNPKLMAMDNAQRQEMAEVIAYQVVIAASAKNEYVRSGNTAQLAQLRQSVTQMMQQRGIDITHQRLTGDGFVKSAA